MLSTAGLVVVFVAAAVNGFPLSIVRNGTGDSVIVDEEFKEHGLHIHNYYRQLYKVNDLQLDQELNKLAHAHAEKLASWNNMTASEIGFYENLWSHRGELLPFVKDIGYAVRCWYTGSSTPGHVQASINTFVLRTDSVNFVGFGVGTSKHNGEGYTVVVALYQ